MMPAPRQLALDLPLRSALGMEDFLVSSSNREAVGLIDSWPNWPHWAAVVAGPQGSGKTHLAHVWQHRSGATRIPAADLSEGCVAGYEAHNALLVEDIDRGIGDDRVLFHLLNLARETKGAVLLTSRQAPGELDIALPDLRSRLRALPLVAIAPPDDALLGSVLVKLFADRQLTVEPQVISFILQRSERSMAAANEVVELLDRHALATRRRVTRQLVSEVLREASREEPS